MANRGCCWLKLASQMMDLLLDFFRLLGIFAQLPIL
jgi:hypothetical protein